MWFAKPGALLETDLGVGCALPDRTDVDTHRTLNAVHCPTRDRIRELHDDERRVDRATLRTSSSKQTCPRFVRT